MYTQYISSAGATSLSFARFGRGTGLIALDEVQCTGSELRLLDCPYDPNTADCFHQEDASVRCITSDHESNYKFFSQLIACCTSNMQL